MNDYDTAVINAWAEGKFAIEDLTDTFDKQIEDLNAAESKIKKRLEELSKKSDKSVKELVENIGKTHELMSMNSEQFASAMKTFYENAGGYVEGIKAAIQEYGNAVLERMRSSYGFNQKQATDTFWMGGEGKNEGKFKNIQEIDAMLLPKDSKGNYKDFAGSQEAMNRIMDANTLRFSWAKTHPKEFDKNPYITFNGEKDVTGYIDYRIALFRQMGNEEEAKKLEEWKKRNSGITRKAFNDALNKKIKRSLVREKHTDGTTVDYYATPLPNLTPSNDTRSPKQIQQDYRNYKKRTDIDNADVKVSKNAGRSIDYYKENAKKKQEANNREKYNTNGKDVGGLVGWTGPGQFNEVAYDVDVHRGELVIPRGDLVKVSSAAGYGSDPFMGAKFVRKLVDRSMQGSPDSPSNSHNVNIESYLELIAMGVGSIVDNTASIQIPVSSSSSSNDVEVNQSQLV